MSRTDIAAIAPSTRLPALTGTEAEEIGRITQHSISELLTCFSLQPNTLRSYRTALKYWNLWHIAAFDQPLPLLRDPPEAVTGPTVQAFIAHHRPVEKAGVVHMAMPGQVLERMLALDAFGKRYVHRRSASSGLAVDQRTRVARIDEHVPSLATIRQRVAALNALHDTLGVTPKPSEADPHISLLLRAVKRSASEPALRPILRKPKQPVSGDVFRAMLLDCEDDGLIGLRDAAILHSCFSAGGRRRGEVASMHLADLSFGEASGRRCIEWSIRESKGMLHNEATGSDLNTRLIGAAAVALEQWCRVITAAGKPAAGPVWYHVRTRRKQLAITAPMDAEDIAARIKHRVARQGLDPDDYGAHSLRSGAITYGLENGMLLEEVSLMAGHASVTTTQRHYDKRKRSAADAATKLSKLQQDR